MRTFITFILVWFVVVDSFSLPEIVEKAEEEILEETKEYNAKINPMKKLYKSRKVTNASKAMGLRNKLFRKIKRSLLDDGVIENEALQLASQAVKDRSDSLIYPGGQKRGIGAGHGQPFKDMCDIEELECDEETPFRSIDGTCNNLEEPTYGAMCTPFIRSGIEPLPFDPIGIFQRTSLIEEGGSGPCIPRQSNQPPEFLPSPRLVSTTIFLDNDVPDTVATHMVTQFAQFVDHDTTFTPEEEEEDCSCDHVSPDFQSFNEACAPIRIPLDDPFFSTEAEPPQVCLPLARSLRFCEGHEERYGEPEEQINGITHFVDASNVYGSDDETANILRTHATNDTPGQLKINNGLLPIIDGEFRGGDVRAREMPALTAMHTVWVREHNRIAEIIDAYTEKSDEEIFQEARHIVSALMQKVVYGEWLPLLLGTEFVQDPANKLDLPISGTTYDPNIDPSTENGFATAAFRFGHSMIQGLIQLVNFQTKELISVNAVRDNLFNDTKYEAMDGIDNIFAGLCQQPAQTNDEMVTEEVTNFLLMEEGNNFGQDLVSRNLQRARDHALGDFLAFRARFSGINEDIDSFDCFENTPEGISEEDWENLRSLYQNVNDIDLFVGGLLEAPVEGGLFGATFRGIIADQFARLRDGDRFFFTHNNEAGSLSEAGRQYIMERKFSDIICDNTNLVQIQPNAFKVPNDSDNVLSNCIESQDTDLIQLIQNNNFREPNGMILGSIGCMDDSQFAAYCPAWGSFGYCETGFSAFMNKHCKQTCNNCCNDESHLCPELVSDLSCENEFIAHLCPSSCDNCNPESLCSGNNGSDNNSSGNNSNGNNGSSNNSNGNNGSSNNSNGNMGSGNNGSGDHSSGGSGNGGRGRRADEIPSEDSRRYPVIPPGTPVDEDGNPIPPIPDLE